MRLTGERDVRRTGEGAVRTGDRDVRRTGEGDRDPAERRTTIGFRGAPGVTRADRLTGVEAPSLAMAASATRRVVLGDILDRSM